jgi:hypothetical protein
MENIESVVTKYSAGGSFETQISNKNYEVVMNFKEMTPFGS